MAPSGRLPPRTQECTGDPVATQQQLWLHTAPGALPRLWQAEAGEDRDCFCRQLITCIGNRRALLGPIGAALDRVKRRLGRKRRRVFDALAGSGVVLRFLKAPASYLASNDIEDFAVAGARCFLHNRSTVDMAALQRQRQTQVLERLCLVERH